MIGIIYISKHGTTKKVAEKIKSSLSDEVTLINLRKNKKPDISGYDKIILGGSIHMGRIQKRMQVFCETNLEELLKKQIALFLCCMEDEKAKMTEQFNNAFPEVLRNHSIKNEILGGEFLLDKMNFIEKAMIKKIARVEENVSKIKEQKIEEFAKAVC